MREASPVERDRFVQLLLIIRKVGLMNKIQAFIHILFRPQFRFYSAVLGSTYPFQNDLLVVTPFHKQDYFPASVAVYRIHLDSTRQEPKE